MKGLLVRVGIDQAYGGWNAPVDPGTLEFAYVPIPEGSQRSELATPYRDVEGALAGFPGFELPAALHGRMMHLDPDFECLTYGDNGARRGRRVAELGPRDFIAFFAGLKPIRALDTNLVYALVGFYWVKEVVRAVAVPPARWGENAHTRRVEHSAADVIVRAEPSGSGRLRRCIPIGEWRDRSYRVRRGLLRAWGHLSSRDGYIQRSAVPPSFLAPERFLRWFDEQHPDPVAANNPGPAGGWVPEPTP